MPSMRATPSTPVARTTTPDTILTDPAAARALRWWSAGALTTLSQRLDGCLRAWTARWDLTLEDLALSNAQQRPDGAPTGPDAWHGWLGQAGSGLPWIWTGATSAGSHGVHAVHGPLGQGETLAQSVGRAMFGRAADGSIAYEAAQLATDELGDELSRRFGHALHGSAGRSMPPRVAAWSGSVIARLDLRGAETLTLWLLLDGDSAATLLRDLPRPGAAAALPPLQSTVTAAIAAHTAALRVELAPVVIDLGTLQSLRVGDVLPLPHRLERPLELRAPDDARIACLGYLGARDGHRAVELLPTSDTPVSGHPADRLMNDSTSSRADSAPTAHVLALNELHDIPTGARPAIGEAVNPLHNIRTRLQVCVGHVELTVGQLMSAREHEVFVLDRLVDQPVDILLEGKVVARGQLVAVDDQFAVRLSEIPTPLKV
ncbi:hypothetical protein CDL60_12900 [Roseateles noduli]|nr:hypothetical protein CDL60_12900 [Roseateles noduli]